MSDHFAALSDRGSRRDNQDEALARELPDGYVLLLVADGAGGMASGEVASAETVKAVLEVLSGEPEGDPAERLRQAATRANEAVREIARTSFGKYVMASTLVCALVRESTAWVANIGDSRAYLSREGRLEQLTEDDSWVAEQLRKGTLDPDDIRLRLNRNVITKAIGVEETAEVRITQVALEPGDTLLLCSDGLHNAVPEQTVAELLAGGTAPSVATALVAAANENGGPDNIGVALYQHAQSDARP